MGWALGITFYSKTLINTTMSENLSKDEQKIERKSKEKITDMLSESESIKAKYFDVSQFHAWYATNKRVVKYYKVLGFEKVAELPYRHITSITYKQTSLWWIWIIAGFIIILGLALMSVEDLLGFIALIEVLLIPLGFLKSISYKFTGAGIDQNEWSISYNYMVTNINKLDKIKSFINEVRKHLP